MEFTECTIPGLLLIKPRLFEDERGYFCETYHKEKFREAGIVDEFVQDNQSLSHRHVLRGLHFQREPMAQGKLVRVLRGGVLDVAVDLRKGSSTYGKHELVELNEKNHLMFWIPAGFAHGFLTLEDNTLFVYKCTQPYNRESEGGIRWDDPELGIDWGSGTYTVSARDQELPTLRELSQPNPADS